MSELYDLKFSALCESLESEEKLKRKQALQDVLKNILNMLENLDEKRSWELWEVFHRPVVRILHDPVEACRDLALEVLKKFLLHLPPSDKNIVYIIPILTKRLASEELIETSEEVRLKCIIFLRAIVLKYQDKLKSYFDDLTKILTRTVTDKYPNVKKESCECIVEIAKAMPKEFYEKSEAFVKPILVNISHQHYKIRMITIQTISEVLLFGKDKIIDVVAGPLAERLFDQSGAVRTAVVEVVGRWMVEFKDRYSYWHKLMPLLLTGMNDVISEIRQKATNLWLAAGKQYIRENEEDKKFKDKLDFLLEELPHYPPNIIRPNLGCRTIAQQNFSKLISALIRELHDWMADIKLRAAQLLCVLVLNVEEEVTMHLPKLLPALYRACHDEDKRVVENVDLTAEYMGYFVLPKVYCEFILPAIEDNPTFGHLKIFAAILRGSRRDELVLELPKIGSILKTSHTCRSRKAPYQYELLSCCRSILRVCDEDCCQISQDLFTVIFTTLALSAESAIETKAKSLLHSLAKIEKFDNVSQLLDKYVPTILSEIQESPESWTVISYEFGIFQTCMTYAKTTSYKNLNLIHPIIEKTTQAIEDKKLRLKQYILLSEYLEQWDKPLEEDSAKIFVDFANVILEKVIIPGLTWTAGRSAEAIRTASICCLCTLLKKIVNNCEVKDETTEEQKSNMSLDQFGWLFDTVRPTLVSMMEDDAPKIRLCCLQALCFIINIGQKLNYITEEHIHKISPEIVTRLEDKNDEIRLAAIEAIKEIWKVLPKNYDLSFYYVHIEYTYVHTLTHLDDPGEQFQKHMLDCLMELAKIHPKLLLKKIEKSRENFINQKALDKLAAVAEKYLKEKKSSK